MHDNRIKTCTTERGNYTVGIYTARTKPLMAMVMIKPKKYVGSRFPDPT
jgi:hypothetical protein